ncbi:MAG: PAS domain S-box protein [Rhodospirillaceae bacterium]
MITADERHSPGDSAAGLRLAAHVGAFGLVVGLAGWLGIQLAFPGNLSPLWPPAGIAVAAVLWRGPWFLAGLWAGGAVADIIGGIPPLVALPMELGAVAEVALVVLVIRRWGGGLAGVMTVRGTLALLGGSALLGCPVGATLGGFVMAGIAPDPAAAFAGHWFVWWLGDTSGILLVAPALLCWRRVGRLRLKAPRAVWWPLYFGLLSLAGGALFFRPWTGAAADLGHALTYLAFPFIAVAGLWLGTMGVTAAVGLTTALALAGAFRGLGPFVGGPVMTNVMLLQIYAIAMAVTGQMLAAVRYERIRALQAMVRSTDRLMVAERLAGIGWWQLSDATGDRAWSDGMFHVLGVEPGTLTPGRDSFDPLVDAADRPLLDRYRSALPILADGEGIEFRVHRPDGAERWVVCRHTAAPDGSPAHFGIVKDITDQKRQTLALHESEQTLRRVFDQSPIGIAIVSLDFRFLKVNETLCRLTGYSAAELLSRSVADITHPEDMVKSFAGAPALLADEVEQLVVEKRYLRKDGGVLWINLLARPIRDDAGRPLHYVSMMEDITERKRTEQALAEAKQTAEHSSQAKSRFLAATSHDLRQPLMAAGLFLESLSRRLSAEERPAPELERVRQALTAMTELLDMLLDLSQLDSGIVRVERRPISLGRLLGDLARNWSEVAAAQGLELRSVPTTAIVDTDPVLLKRILRNLLDNAVKYTTGGHILLGCRRAGAEVRIQVWDTGVGIPTEKLEAIFGEFYQIGNPNRDRSRGLGMGLSIVERLAALLGCPLSVRSRPGRGSMFEIALPLTGRCAAAPLPETIAALPVPAGPVVVIEDDSLVAEALETLLTSWGWTAIVASGAEAAWARLSALGAAPVLVIADYRLADGWTGIEAVAWLRERLNTVVPAVLSSGDTSDEQERRIRASGLRLIPKPITADTLRAILLEYC